MSRAALCKKRKPTIILAIDESGTTAKGSGRSISALNLYEALNEVREQFTHFGGHHMAAGMTLPVENIPFVQEHLAHFIEKIKLIWLMVWLMDKSCSLVRA